MGGYWNVRAREALSMIIEDEARREELVPLYGMRMFLEHCQAKGCKPLSTEGASDAVREGLAKVMAMKSLNAIPEIQGGLAPRGVGAPASDAYVAACAEKSDEKK